MHRKVLKFIENEKRSFDTFQDIAGTLKVDRETVSRHVKDELGPKGRICLYKGTYYWGSPQEQVDAYIDWNNFKEALDDPDVFKAIWNYTLKKMEIDLDKNTTFKEVGTIEIPYPTEKGWKVIEEQKKKAEN